jgi:chromosome segregation ATPase
MKPTIISHPLKRIHFNYNSEAALSDFETAFIDRYKQLHDELAAIKSQLLQLGPDIKKVLAELKQVTTALEKLRTIIVRTERMFGLGPADEIVSCAYNIKSGEIQKVLDELQVIRSNYRDMMVPMHKLFNSIFERFTAFDDAVEQFEKEYSDPLFHNFENMAIDIRSFDNDMNEFRAAWMDVAHLQDECLDEYSEWVKNQTALVNDSDSLYDRIKKIFQHINTIQKFNPGNKENKFGLN